MLKKLTLLAAASLIFALGTGTAEAQKKGGVLKFATPSVRPGLDPAHTRTGDAYMLTGMIFSNLTRIDHELKPQPQLPKPTASSVGWQQMPTFLVEA